MDEPPGLEDLVPSSWFLFSPRLCVSVVKSPRARRGEGQGRGPPNPRGYPPARRLSYGVFGPISTKGFGQPPRLGP